MTDPVGRPQERSPREILERLGATDAPASIEQVVPRLLGVLRGVVNEDDITQVALDLDDTDEL